MAKLYRVLVSRELVQTAFVDVKADDPEDACAKAEDKAFSMDDSHWDTIDTSAIEVIETEEQ